MSFQAIQQLVETELTRHGLCADVIGLVLKSIPDHYSYRVIVKRNPEDGLNESIAQLEYDPDGPVPDDVKEKHAYSLAGGSAHVTVLKDVLTEESCFWIPVTEFVEYTFECQFFKEKKWTKLYSSTLRFYPLDEDEWEDKKPEPSEVTFGPSETSYIRMRYDWSETPTENQFSRLVLVVYTK